MDLIILERGKIFMYEPVRFLTKLVAVVALSSLCNSTAAERIHLLVPGGAGGGWDTTARGVGEALAKSSLVSVASYQNLSGGGGSKAMAHLIETADRQEDTLMISSTPIILRSLQGIFPQSWKDLTPVSSVIVDYGALVVRANSSYQHWDDVLEQFKENSNSINVAGGSALGSMDHLVAALAFKKSGLDARNVKYIPYNAGAQAMVGLLSGECQLLSTGLSEAIALSEQGEVRILAMTAPERLDSAPDIPTLVEQGANAVFLNWRGFFGPPGLSDKKQTEYKQLFLEMYKTEQWKSVRDSRGWSDFYTDGKDFIEFLKQQEKQLSALMDDLDL